MAVPTCTTGAMGTSLSVAFGQVTPCIVIFRIKELTARITTHFQHLSVAENILYLCVDSKGMVTAIGPEIALWQCHNWEIERAPQVLKHTGFSLAIVSKEQLLNPAATFALSVSGCDIVLLITDDVTDEDRKLYAVRAVEQLAVAVVTRQSAFLSLPPQSHSRWVEMRYKGPGVVTWNVDLSETRKKHFIRHIDYSRLAGLDTYD